MTPDVDEARETLWRGRGRDCAVDYAERLEALEAAIRAEARAAALDEARAAVAGLPGWHDPRYSGQFESKGLVGREQALAAIDALRERSGEFSDTTREDGR